MDDNSSSSLSAEQKLALQSYVGSLIKGWLALLGVANLAVLAGAFGYIFFLLPKQMIPEVTKSMESEISEERDRLSKIVQENLVQFGREQERIDDLNRDLEKTNCRKAHYRSMNMG